MIAKVPVSTARGTDTLLLPPYPPRLTRTNSSVTLDIAAVVEPGGVDSSRLEMTRPNAVNDVEPTLTAQVVPKPRCYLWMAGNLLWKLFARVEQPHLWAALSLSYRGELLLALSAARRILCHPWPPLFRIFMKAATQCYHIVRNEPYRRGDIRGPGVGCKPTESPLRGPNRLPGRFPCGHRLPLQMRPWAELPDDQEQDRHLSVYTPFIGMRDPRFRQR